jgi:hypothetical protein
MQVMIPPLEYPCFESAAFENKREHYQHLWGLTKTRRQLLSSTEKVGCRSRRSRKRPTEKAGLKLAPLVSLIEPKEPEAQPESPVIVRMIHSIRISRSKAAQVASSQYQLKKLRERIQEEAEIKEGKIREVISSQGPPLIEPSQGST